MAVTILPSVQTNLIRYVGSMYFAMGVIGNVCNCIVFVRQIRRQKTPCSIYLFSLSIFAMAYLVWSIFPLLYTLNHVDPQIQSLAYCKLRLYGSHVLGLLMRFSVVFACADRYFITRTSARIRAWSSPQMARKLIIVNCLLCPVIGLHVLVFMDIRDGVCWMFDFYKFFYPIYQCIIIGTIPPMLMGLFGFLTFRSLQQRHVATTNVRQKDHDLMRMLIAEIMINIFTSIPYSIDLLYGIAAIFVSNKSPVRVEIEAFLSFLTLFIIHVLSVAPFYLFIISSKSFRHEFSQIWINWWYKYILRSAQIVPINIVKPLE